MSAPTEDCWPDWFDGLARRLRDLQPESAVDRMPLVVQPSSIRRHEELVEIPIYPPLPGELW